MKPSFLVLCVAALLGSVLSACGDDAAHCTSKAGCGGDLVGNWDGASACLQALVDDVENLYAFCDQATLDLNQLDLASARVTFGKDKTFDERLAFSGKLVLHLPASCLIQQGVKLKCDALIAPAPADATSDATPNLSCKSVTGGDCECSGALPAIERSGSYTVKGSVVTQTSDDGSSHASDFCVQGNTLSLRAHAADVAMMNQLGLEASLTLTRK